MLRGLCKGLVEILSRAPAAVNSMDTIVPGPSGTGRTSKESVSAAINASPRPSPGLSGRGAVPPPSSVTVTRTDAPALSALTPNEPWAPSR